MLDTLLQYLAGRKPDGIANVPWHQVFVYLRFGKGSISPPLISFHNRLQDLPPTISAVNIARPQYHPFTVPKLGRSLLLLI